MLYIGIDHGTTAIRVAVVDKGSSQITQTYEIMKRDGPFEFMDLLKSKVDVDDIEMVAVAYSMGDAISAITPIEKLKDRGLVSIKGIGPRTGVGTAMFDQVAASSLPAVALPGLHRDCPWLDPRFTYLQSHIGSPEKLAASFHCFNEILKDEKVEDAIISNISSNTVTILIKDGKIKGGVDACLGAPGLHHGPLDVEALRRIDSGDLTANEAFSTGGILRPPLQTFEEFIKALKEGDGPARLAMESLIIAVAMEISGLRTVTGEIDSIAVTGALGEMTDPIDIGAELGQLLRTKVRIFSRFSAALGAAEIASLVKEGTKDILGVPVIR